MKNRNRIQNLNIKVKNNSSKTVYLTPRNNEKFHTLTLESNKHLFTNSSKLKTRFNYPLTSTKTTSYSMIPKNITNIHKDIQITDCHLKDIIFNCSPKYLDNDDYSSNERLITSSTQFSKLAQNKEKISKLTKRTDKRKNKNLNNFNTLINLTNNKVNEVSFIPSPNLINTSLLAQKISFLNYLKINKNKKEKEKNKKYKSEGKMKLTIKDKKLPIFLRDKYNIKGTNIISPFCIQARDDSLYKRIFHTYFTKSVIIRKEEVPNKLNIIYAENEAKLMKTISNINKKRRKQGKKDKNAIFPNSVGYKLGKIKNKIKFIKKIVDYAYPEMVLTRVREANKILESTRNMNKLPPFKSADYRLKQHNKIITKELSRSLNICKV
jgi:hypothetical protein